MLAHAATPIAVYAACALGSAALGVSGLLSLCPLLLGSIVAAQGAGADVSRTTRASSYHSGRLLGYTIVGALFGTLGWLLMSPQSPVIATQALAPWLYAAAGTSMMIAGVSIFTRRSIGVLPIPGPGSILSNTRWFTSLVASAVNHDSPFSLGILVGLLPCIPLMPVAVIAAASGTPVMGMVFGLSFGFGTLAALALHQSTPVPLYPATAGGTTETRVTLAISSTLVSILGAVVVAMAALLAAA